LQRFFSVRTWWVETLDLGRVFSRAIVSIDVNSETVTAMGEGVGPVHALDEAIKSAISKKFPELADIKLVNYKVTVLDSNDGTAAAVRVYTEFVFGDKNWATTAVSRNIVEASLKAILDGYIYMLATMSGGRSYQI
jgi:2-isopropylmalate synthase